MSPHKPWFDIIAWSKQSEKLLGNLKRVIPQLFWPCYGVKPWFIRGQIMPAFSELRFTGPFASVLLFIRPERSWKTEMSKNKRKWKDKCIKSKYNCFPLRPEYTGAGKALFFIGYCLGLKTNRNKIKQSVTSVLPERNKVRFGGPWNIHLQGHNQY